MVGISDAIEEGKWVSVNDESEAYVNWAKGEPYNLTTTYQEDCARITGGGFYDQDCAELLQSVCSKLSKYGKIFHGYLEFYFNNLKNSSFGQQSAIYFISLAPHKTFLVILGQFRRERRLVQGRVLQCKVYELFFAANGGYF